MWVAIVSVIAGVVARTLIPFLEKLIDTPEMPFDKKFLVPAIAALVISLVTFPLILPQIDLSLPWYAIFASAYVINDLSRIVQKTIASVRSR